MHHEGKRIVSNHLKSSSINLEEPFFKKLLYSQYALVVF